MENRNAIISSTMGLSGWLFITFLVLKLTEYIDWSWWWVTAPLWGPTVFALVVITIGLALFGIVLLVSWFASLLVQWFKSRKT